jgi:hypothetical protein
MKIILNICFLFLASIIFTGCDKGYEVRCSNYYTEELDSVIIGSQQITFHTIETGITTGFSKIKQGNHAFVIISKSKKKFYSVLSIPKTGTGKRTIQIDGVAAINVLEE